MLKPRSKIRVPRRGMAGTSVGGEDYDSIWRKLASALREIHTKNASKLSFEELYRASYQLVVKKQGERLYDDVCNLEADFFQNCALKTLQDAIPSTLVIRAQDFVAHVDSWTEHKEAGEKILAVARQVWEDQTLCLGMIHDVLIYMDRALTSENKRKPIYTSGMNIFRDNVLRKPCKPDSRLSVLNILLDTTLFLIHTERSGHSIDRASIHQILLMLNRLSDSDDDAESMRLYATQFEPLFLQESRKFYVSEGTDLLGTADAVSFCRHVQRRLEEEKERCDITLLPTTAIKVQRLIDEHLIKPNIHTVINMEGSGVRHMLDNDRIDDLNILFRLISRVDSQKIHLRNAFRSRIVDLGDQLNSAAAEASKPAGATRLRPSSGDDRGKKTANEKAPNLNQQTVAAIKWVDDVLSLKAKYDKIWERAFEGDHALQATLTDSFKDFINTNDRGSEYISLFFDENLKKGIKGKTEEEVDLLLDRGITLLRFISDRDVFEQYYKKHLSRRLLLRRSVSMDAEKQIISKMKIEVGTQFTSKLEAMFADMATSADMSSAFKDHMARGGIDGKPVELDVSVLTSTRWPIEMITRQDGEGVPIQYPPTIDRMRTSFEHFYYGKHSGRKLSWQLNMGTADLRAVFPRPNGKLARHELNVSTYAMFILLLFNDLSVEQSLSFEDIRARTGIPVNELTRNLQSLAVAPKTRVLRKEPMSKDINDGDRFYFNEKFQSPYMKIKIGVVSNAGNKVETKEQRKETEEKTGMERKVTIEAAIVRIMKQRKELTHTQLVTEVIQQLSSRFNPDMAMLKGRIEDLIEREYIERVADSDPPAYAYVA
ncbi:Cullin-3 [Ascosphaera aggregata]|nr:Cullin-3 [Ascosphaera aggregata]